MSETKRLKNLQIIIEKGDWAFWRNTSSKQNFNPTCENNT